jgi:hypothetical protein
VRAGLNRLPVDVSLPHVRPTDYFYNDTLTIYLLNLQYNSVMIGCDMNRCRRRELSLEPPPPHGITKQTLSFPHSCTAIQKKDHTSVSEHLLIFCQRSFPRQKCFFQRGKGGDRTPCRLFQPPLLLYLFKPRGTMHR